MTGGEGFGGHEPQVGQLLSSLHTAAVEVIRDAPSWYGRTTIAGTIVNPSQHDLVVVENQWTGDDEVDAEVRAGELAEGTRGMALHAISSCVLGGEDIPPGLVSRPASIYYVEEKITEIPEIAEGHIGVLEVRVPEYQSGTEEFVTITSISSHGIPGSGEEFLYAHLWSKGGRVLKVDMAAVPHEDEAHYDNCLSMFGQNSRAQQLMEGLFADEAELDEALEEIREAAATVGIYDEVAVDAVLSNVRRMGRNAQESRGLASGVTEERLERLVRFVSGRIT